MLRCLYTSIYAGVLLERDTARGWGAQCLYNVYNKGGPQQDERWLEMRWNCGVCVCMSKRNPSRHMTPHNCHTIRIYAVWCLFLFFCFFLPSRPSAQNTKYTAPR